MALSRSTRRCFLRSSGRFVAGAGLLPLMGPGVATAQPPVPTRRNIANLDPNGPEIAQLREAFRTIQQRPATNRTSWIFQANIHATSCAHENWWFLPWHRAYLYAFERILQAAVGDPTLMLPYWDWSSPAGRTVPGAFWGANNPLNPLANDFTLRRAIGPTSQMAAEMVANPIPGILNTMLFSTFGGRASSSPLQRVAAGNLEGTPHNYVHRRIGGAMRDPSFAARDPIFWLHHANIDRLWVEWTIRHPNAQPTSSTWRNRSFTFYNTAGQPIPIFVSQVLNLGPSGLNYQYEGQEAAPAAPLVAMGKQPVEEPPAIARVEGTAPNPALGPRPVSVPLELSPAFGATLRGLEEQAIQPPARPVSLQLAIEGMRIPANPEVIVRVFLNKPDADAQTPIEDPHYVGSFTFFVTEAHGPAHGAGHPMPPDGGTAQLLDATESVRRLLGSGALRPGRPLTVTLVTVPIAQEPEPDAVAPAQPPPVIPFRSVSLSVFD